MFKYTSTTIINSDVDKQSGKAMFASISADDKHGATLKILRDYTFEMPGITKVYKHVAAEPTMAELTIDCDALLTSLTSILPDSPLYPISGRLTFFITLEGSEESVFSNDFYQKGAPFSVGFFVKSADTTGTQIAEQITKNFVKFGGTVLGRKVFDVSYSGSTVTITCTGEYERIKTIVALADFGLVEREIAHLIDGVDDDDQDVFTLVERGTNGFGTFRHLMKDLRLPTAMNTSWTALYKSDKPIPGALYNQYIIYYNAPSGTNPSLVAVGDETLSYTTHIYWVKQEYAEEFENVVAEVVGSGPVKDDPTAIFEEV